MANIGSEKFLLDGEWQLSDLSSFGYTLERVYGFLYWFSSEEFQVDRDKEFAVNKYPWQGGYSTVNFYNEVVGSIEKQERPRVKSIQYASPGYIEIAGVLIFLLNLKRIIKIVAETVETVDSTYDRIYKNAQERKLLRLKVDHQKMRLEAEDAKFLIESTQELAASMGFKDFRLLNKKTNDSYAAFKMILSFYRKVRDLVDLVKSGKLKL